MIKINRFIINTITSLRILFGFLFLLGVIFNVNTIYLIIIFLLTAISDISDGWLSRKYNLSSDNGGKLDVICDFIFIILSTSALVLTDLIPSWFLIIIIFKLIEFFKTSDESLTYDKFGHFVALMFYAFPIITILLNNRIINLLLVVFITICALISSLSRIYRKFY